MTCSIALALFVVFVSFYYFQSRAAISGNKPICQGGRLLTSLSRERLPIGMGYPGAPIVEIYAACSGAPPHRPSQGSGLIFKMRLHQGFATGEMGFGGQLARQQSQAAHFRFSNRPVGGQALRRRAALWQEATSTVCSIVSSQTARPGLRELRSVHRA